MDGLTCSEGNGGFHFGSDLDVHVFGVDDLPTREGGAEDDHGTASCFGSQRIRLSKGQFTTTVPHFTAKTRLFTAVADPQNALDRSFKHTMELLQGYGRKPVGDPKGYSTRTMVMKCQQNVTDTFPMTTCFWANYSAVGSIDFFPPNGEHVPLDQAAERTRTFATAALSTQPATAAP
ncbi:hypothetical protein [Kitasatospora sp. NPDC093558]|uniref:hypothetical protein n=1 Tax=Kitasatospora sp. NPDC093558 TaxID=3155201 RepID=UPI00343A84DD